MRESRARGGNEKGFVVATNPFFSGAWGRVLEFQCDSD